VSNSPMLLDSLTNDVRSAFRGLLRRPALALTAILAAALGVGATSAVFSVVDRILFRPLPYAHEDRLVSVGMSSPYDVNEFMFAEGYFDLRRNPGPLEAVTAFQAGTIGCDLNLENPARLKCLRVESNFLDTLGIAPLAGRSFTREEDLPNGPRVAMISYGLWRSAFAADPSIVGRTMPLDGAATVIVGVLPRNFEMPTLTPSDILIPLALNEATERAGRALRVFGRMKPGISVIQARAQLQPYFERILATVPAQFRKEVGLRVQSVRNRQTGSDRLASLALLGAVLAVLLIACANITNLLLARAVARERELAMRAVLGATRWRLARLALTESLILGIAGGIAGAGFAYALLRFFVSIAPQGLMRLQDASIDFRVLLFALAASIGSSVLFGTAPALRTARAAALNSWRATPPSTGGLRAILVSAQIAISLMLLTGAGLLLRSLWKLESVPLGMETERVLVAHIELGRQRYSHDADLIAFYDSLEQRIAALPGVEAAAITDSLPPSGAMRFRPYSSIEIEGQPKMPQGTGGMVSWRYVTPGYFSTLEIPILQGRAFTEADRASSEPPVIVSQSLARRMFPNESPLGKHILKSAQGEWYTVIGIAADVKNGGIAEKADPEFYELRKGVLDFTFAEQGGSRAAYVVLRTAISPGLVANSLRSAIAAIDPTLPADLQPMSQRLGELESRPRFAAVLLVAFAAMGVLLAGIGLFGVMSFLVAQRTREIGVRMALGATPRHIVAWTLGHAARWTIAGVLVGLAGSFAGARLIRSMLFQVGSGDPGTLAIAVVFLCAVALLAAAIPSRRAARLAPVQTLRED
jgi:putative ABC transport system permease protein